MFLYKHDDRCITTWRSVASFPSGRARQYLNHKFPNRWIGRGGAQNWPPRSPDQNPLDYHVWGYVKAMAYAHKVNTREELLQRILSAARNVNNAAVLRGVTSSVVTRVRKCIQADGGQFEQFAWVLNGESVTVHLIARLNKCTVLLFPLWFVYCALNLVTPEPLRNGSMCIWRFWLRISSGMKSLSSDLNSWDTLYIINGVSQMHMLCDMSNVRTHTVRITLNFKRRIKSHLPFAGIIRSSPYSPGFQDKG